MMQFNAGHAVIDGFRRSMLGVFRSSALHLGNVAEQWGVISLHWISLIKQGFTGVVSLMQPNKSNVEQASHQNVFEGGAAEIH